MEISEVRQDLKNNYIIQEAVRHILCSIGEKPDREGLKRTPFRYAKACEEWFGGYAVNPEKVLNRSFTESSDMVIEGPIKFFSHCEHHIAPFYGEIWIGYIPKKVVTGLDKMVKLVEVYSRRLQVQERLTEQIANTMFKTLDCKGVMVVCKAYHLCVSSRETKNPSTYTITSAIRGVFAKPPKGHNPREEFIRLIKL